MTLPREVARARLRAAGYVLVQTFANATVELWRHPRVGDVRLLPELDGTGAYEEMMILLVEAQAREG